MRSGMVVGAVGESTEAVEEQKRNLAPWVVDWVKLSRLVRPCRWGVKPVREMLKLTAQAA